MTLAVILLFIITALSYVGITMLSNVTAQIARLNELAPALAQRISDLASERDVLRARVAELEANVATNADLDAAASALAAQVDVIASLAHGA